MLKKLFYVGLGISIIVVRKSISYFLSGQHEGEEAANSRGGKPVSSSDVLSEATRAISDAMPVEQTKTAKDDLTQIKGVGPTYAKRLHAAGILTFADVAAASPDRLREVTNATGKAADTESWIEQAAALV